MSKDLKKIVSLPENIPPGYVPINVLLTVYIRELLDVDKNPILHPMRDVNIPITRAIAQNNRRIINNVSTSEKPL